MSARPDEPLTFDLHGEPLAITTDRGHVPLHIGADTIHLSPPAAALRAAALTAAVTEEPDQ
jgi:hypothetical protein